jgi:hypothetical protein
MMEKLAQPGEGGGFTPTPFQYIYHHVQIWGVRSSLEGRYTPPISTLPLCTLPICTLWFEAEHTDKYFDINFVHKKPKQTKFLIPI